MRNRTFAARSKAGGFVARGTIALTLSTAAGLSAIAICEDLVLHERIVEAGDLRYDAAFGKLTVPQIHADPHSGSLKLAIAVLKSKSATPGPPVFYLNGIPGAASATRTWERWAPYLAKSDVVLVDQRGTGESSPRLVWDKEPFRAERLFGDTESARTHAVSTAASIREFADQHGIELSAFNTRESARDIDAVRAALSHETIRIIGHSGGSHLGLEYVRQYPERVSHFVSIGTAGPNDIHSLPTELDRSLRQLSDLIADDPRIGGSMPNFYDRFRNALDRLKQRPIDLIVRHSASGREVSLALGPHGLRWIVLFDLADPADFIVFPRMIHEMEHDSFATLSWFVGKRYRQMTKWPAIVFINRGSSGATAERWMKIRKQAKSSVFEMTRCFFSPYTDEAFGLTDLGDDYRQPVESDVPTLFVSGTLDANTPPERATRAAQGLPNSSHLIVENGGHDSILTDPRIHEVVRTFFADPSVIAEGSLRIDQPRPVFALLEGEDDLVTHPSLR